MTMTTKSKTTINEVKMLKKLLAQVEQKCSGDPDEEELQPMVFSSNLTVFGGEDWSADA